jgi:molybdopterin-biosynthesis enzyme MoeA-like protein
MKAIFEESILPKIKEKSKFKFIEKSLRLIGIAESDLSPIIEQAMKNNPGIYIKSHPKHGEGTSLIELHFSTMKEEINEGEKIINKAIEEISLQIIKKGATIEEIS